MRLRFLQLRLCAWRLFRSSRCCGGFVSSFLESRLVRGPLSVAVVPCVCLVVRVRHTSTAPRNYLRFKGSVGFRKSAKSEPFANRVRKAPRAYQVGKLDGPAGGLLCFDLGCRNGHTRSHSGAPKGGVATFFEAGYFTYELPRIRFSGAATAVALIKSRYCRKTSPLA